MNSSKPTADHRHRIPPSGHGRLDLRGLAPRAVYERLDGARILPPGVLVELAVDHRTAWTPTVAAVLAEVAPLLAWSVVCDLDDHRNATALSAWVYRVRAAAEGRR